MEENGGNPAGVDLVVEREHHVWTLEEWPIVEIAFDRTGVRLAVRKMEGSAEVRIDGRFRLADARGDRVLDAAEAETLASLLSLLDRPLRRVRVGMDGILELAIAEAVIEVRPDPRFEAWEAQGAGVLDGFSYRCRRGGGPPWREG